MRTATATNETRPALWIGCLAAYNQGHLHGRWFYPADYSNGEEFGKEVQAFVIGKSPAMGAEEMHVCDHEGWGTYKPDEYWLDWAMIVDLAEYIENESNALALLAYFEHISNEEPTPEAIREGEDRYRGQWDDVDDYYREMADLDIDCHLGGVEESAREFFKNHFDYDSYRRGMEPCFIEIEVDGDTHIFTND